MLEGHIIIEHENGNVQSFGPGESFAIPKGAPCVWKQTEDVRKYYFIFDDPSGAKSDNPAALDAIRIIVPETLPQVDAGDPEQYIGDSPSMGLKSVMLDPTGQFQVGIWESSPIPDIRDARREVWARWCILRISTHRSVRRQRRVCWDSFFPLGRISSCKMEVPRADHRQAV